MIEFCCECFGTDLSQAGKLWTCRTCGATMERTGPNTIRLVAHGTKRASAGQRAADAASGADEWCPSCGDATRLEDIQGSGQVCHACGCVLARRANGSRLVVSTPASARVVWIDPSGYRAGMVAMPVVLHNAVGAPEADVARVFDALKAALRGTPVLERVAVAERMQKFETSGGLHLCLTSNLTAGDGRPALALAELHGSRVQLDLAAIKATGTDLVAVIVHELNHLMSEERENVCALRGAEAALAARLGRSFT